MALSKDMTMAHPATPSPPSSSALGLDVPLTLVMPSPNIVRKPSNSSSRIPSYRLENSVIQPRSETPSTASGSKTGSLISTPQILSRRNSQREKTTSRSSSVKGKAKEEIVTQMEDQRSPYSENEVIETPQLRLERDPGTGRKMINQYLVLHEIGHGTHGRVRLGRDMSVEMQPDEEIDLASDPGAFYAIKIVDRNPKKKRLTGLSRQRGLGRTGRNDGAKLVTENEIRKEIAIFKKVHHPNVVRMKEIIDDPESSKLFMILEYCDGGEIHWKNENGGPALTVEETRRIFRDTLLGLGYLHYQGIIHRDIKPSNLLFLGGKVKISDFGCSHYSEALRVASAGGMDGDAYVDDIELAKTAGSPAFFAPEMCYSGLDTEQPLRQTSTTIPPLEVPALTLRPPSVVDDRVEPRIGRPEAVLSPISLNSNDSTVSTHPSRTQSTSTLFRRARHPITNAIDVWALGVTLYCLLFGKTPFDAPNEYLLMQVIPVAEYELPPTMGKDLMVTGDGKTEEAKECLDLLSRLLEKDPTRRITLEQAKRHPFTLRGLSDPSLWLANADPRAQTFVTVSSDEVAAVVTKSSSFREKFRRGIKNISHKLQFLSAGRHRSRSISDVDSSRDSEPSRASSAAPSETFGLPPPLGGNNRRVASGNDMGASTITVPALVRRLSLLNRESSRAESPQRHTTIQLASPQLERSPLLISGRESVDPTQSKFKVLGRPSHLVPPSSVATIDPIPQKMPSTSSLDKFKIDEISPTASLRRRQSADIEPRPRSSSNASSSTGSILGMLSRNLFTREGLSKTRSLRSNSSQAGIHRQMNVGQTGSLEEEDVSSSESPAEILRGRSLDDIGRRQSLDTFDSESPSSRSGLIPSPDRFSSAWDSRLRGKEDRLAPRRGSTLSEEIRPVHEEVDWNGALPGSDDDSVSSDEYSDPPRTLPSIPADWQLNRVALELDIGAAVASVHASPTAHLASAAPQLEPIPDTSPVMTMRDPLDPLHPPQSPSRPLGGQDLYRPLSRVSQSPYRPNFQERTKSPLGLRDTTFSSPTRPAYMDGREDNLQKTDDDDEGLVLGSKRGRKGSILGKGPSSDQHCAQ